ncbi:hypothetical protein BDV96DRAFT_653 [Lophiotrema nucula]|uniref:Ecp2 effector protein domain-containing protein n=1 Tax=Lophiotrema nucula TaxID=690887 RepID=A0A6A5ZVP6_9PLEO|nr:hypothetical protein BDV96DRAFT_653 [Lophiotrema nucula]
MKVTLALLSALISAIAAAPAGYTPPLDTPEGSYVVRFDASGNAMTKRLEPSVFESHEATSISLTKRNFPGNPSAVCTNRGIPTDGSYSVVQNCLGTWLNQHSGELNVGGYGPGAGGVYYCRQGDTLLAVCLYDQDSIAGSPGEIDMFNGLVDGKCGAWRSGYVFIKNWNKTYHRTTWGETVCGNIATGTRKQVYA